MPRYGLSLNELPHRVSDALDVVERGQGRTVLLRDGAPVAALVSIEDLDRADPPDPGLGGADPLLALCGTCHADWFVDQVLSVYGVVQPQAVAQPLPPPVPSSSLQSSDPLKNRTVFEGPLPPRPR